MIIKGFPLSQETEGQFTLLNRTNIHPLAIAAYPMQGHEGGWSLTPLSLGRRRGTPWKNCQFIAGHLQAT